MIGANQRTAGETTGFVAELSRRVGVSLVNLCVLKNDRAKAIRFSTLTALCEVLECQVGDLFSHEPAGK
ncbi:MAG: helix-turn-helix domain-containing protein [Arthrobacter oryzae]